MARSLTEATRAFLRFRDHGDPEAMARVFDLVAPKLLLLASHLTRDAATAEDLVQTTFLHAIEGASSFDAEYGNVMPWLSQILRCRAQDLRRKGQRESRLLSAHQPSQPLPLDPQVKLENEEAAQEFEAALESLPEKYRSVLILRLVQGMEPKDIGYSLGIDPGTVRTQLKRGLDWIRSRMRYGATLSIAISMIATRGMADVRRVVLESAQKGQEPISHWTRARLRVVAAGAVAVVFVGGMILTFATSGVRDPNLLPADAAATAIGDPEQLSSNRERSEFWATPDDGKPAPEAQRVRTLSVTWANDGQPAANAPLSLRRSDMPINSARLTLHLDERGEAEVDNMAPGIYDVHHYGFGKQYLTVAEDGSSIWFELDGGVRVVAHVIDEAGTAVEGAQIWTSSSLSDLGRFAGVVGVDGWFEFEHAAIDQLFACLLPDGRWTEARIVRGSPEQVVEFELRAKTATLSIRGVVTRTDGKPVPLAYVHVNTCLPLVSLDTHGRWPHHDRRIQADELGEFELQLPADSGRVRLRVTCPGYVPWRTLIEPDQLAEPVQVLLEPGTEIYGRVTDTADRGMPGISVRASADGQPTAETLSDLTGAYRLRGLSAADWTIEVNAGSRGWARKRTRLGTRDRSVRIDHVVAVTGGVKGVTVDANGLPLGGMIITPLVRDRAPSASVSTDMNGRFFIPEVWTQIDTIAIRVRTDTPPVAYHTVGADTLRIELDERSLWMPSAYVKGLIEGPDDESLLLRIEHHATAWTRPCAWSSSQRAFRVGPLPPGGYDLVVHAGAEVRLRIPIRLEPEGDHDLGTHRVGSQR